MKCQLLRRHYIQAIDYSLLVGLPAQLSPAGCWENTIKACRSRAVRGALNLSLRYDRVLPISRYLHVANQGCISRSAHYLEYGRHVARRRLRRAYAPSSNTAIHDDHEKSDSWVAMSMGLCLEPPGPPELRFADDDNGILYIVLKRLKNVLSSYNTA